MKTIEELADALEFTFEQKYSVLSEYEIYRKGIEVGLRAAQRWISIEEDLPEINETVLMKNSFGCYGVGKWDGRDWTFYTIEGVAELSNWISKECTHWRPIELL